MILAQSMGLDLIKLLPDGANVVAVIVVVVLFLKQQEKFNVMLKSITDNFGSEIKGNQEAFQKQIGDLSSQYFNNQRLYQDQIQRLMDAHITVTREVITTLQEVKANVKGINDKMERYEDRQEQMDRQLPAPTQPIPTRRKATPE